jgi:hypothetical protein
VEESLMADGVLMAAFSIFFCSVLISSPLANGFLTRFAPCSSLQLKCTSGEESVPEFGGVQHAGVLVRNTEASVEWFTSVLG